MNQPNILNYNNFRAFFYDEYEYKKKTEKYYSYRKLATNYGLNPTNYFHLVIQGKRNLSLKSLQTILKNLSWASQQKRYFECLVLYNQEESLEKKAKHFEKLNKILGKQRSFLKKEHFSYFGHWYLPVIRELISLKGFVSHLNWMSKKLRPHIPENLIREALSVLEKLKFIKKIKGKWAQSEEHLATEDEVSSEVLFNYHLNLLDLSKQSLEYPAEDRDIAAMTMSVSQDQFASLKQRVRDFRDEIQQELETAKVESSMVCQLNMQLFLVTER